MGKSPFYEFKVKTLHLYFPAQFYRGVLWQKNDGIFCFSRLPDQLYICPGYLCVHLGRVHPGRNEPSQRITRSEGRTIRISVARLASHFDPRIWQIQTESRLKWLKCMKEDCTVLCLCTKEAELCRVSVRSSHLSAFVVHSIQRNKSRK